MQQALTQIAAIAHRQQMAAEASTHSGLDVFACPHGGAMMVGIGFRRDKVRATHLETVLRRRTEYPARYAQWLPALFLDDSWYLVQRVDNLVPGECPVSDEAVAAVLELLA